MARRNEHTRDEMKQLILSAAMDIVENEGFSALKVRRIAAEIDYTVAAIYMVFANMDDLNVHIKRHTLQLLAAELTENSPYDILAMKYVQFVFSHKGLWRMLWEHQLAIDKTLPSEYVNAQQHIINIFCHSLLGGIEGQHQKIAVVFMHGLQGVVMQCLLSNQTLLQSEELVQCFVECFGKGYPTLR